MSILVPWTETNRRLRLGLWIESEDGGDPLMRADGEVEVGRPPGTPEGSDIRSVLAVNATVAFPRDGGYRLASEIDGSKRTYAFRVVDIVVPRAQPAA